MAKVSKYGILFYGGEAGYMNNRAQIQLSDAEGNTLAFVRFKDVGMPYELDTETDASSPCICLQRCFRAFSMPSATKRPTSTIK